MKCDKCQQEIQENDVHKLREKDLCEDCYIASLHQPKPCDPMAVYGARKTREMLGQEGAEGLTERQQNIYEFIKERQKVTGPEIAENLQLPLEEIEKEFAILRHCELVRGFKEGKTKYLTTMD